ncbi:MAG: 16S rRNA (guanine(527)-N(7))-methyltransferase RsmG [Saprospiraceae bacterium]
MEYILKYFNALETSQIDKFNAIEDVYKEWNSQINVISRKDIDNLYLHHVLHSLAIAKFIRFVPGTSILDLGSGGGFPGIPLAILFPECHFLLVDSIRKKGIVAQEVIQATELTNVTFQHARVEDIKSKHDFVVSRAVAKIDKLLPWSRKVIHQKHKNLYPNGLIALKGDLNPEIALLPKHEYYETVKLTDYFEEPYFSEKSLLYIQA